MTVKAELECEKKELLIREPQYNVVSDAVLLQPMPSVGDAVVIVQHATIPFGARAVVTSGSRTPCGWRCCWTSRASPACRTRASWTRRIASEGRCR